MGVSFEHRPVMVDEVVATLAPVPPGVVIDATVGGGGHASALLEQLDHITLLGLDRDGDAITAAAERLAPFGDRVTLRRVRFDALGETVKELKHEAIAGALFDLGVSSPQVDRAARGFSYRSDGPLDMRMDQDQPRTAADIVNTYAEPELARVLRENGDERFAGRIARAIVAARPVTSTGELAALVRDAIPAPARRRGGNPAKRTFQALRIEVNGELVALPLAIDQAIEHLQPGGRCVVLSYHSGEDRIVKERFRHAATGGCTCPPNLPCTCGAVRTVKELRPLKRRASAAEIAENRRAESVIFRAVERI